MAIGNGSIAAGTPCFGASINNGCCSGSCYDPLCGSCDNGSVVPTSCVETTQAGDHCLACSGVNDYCPGDCVCVPGQGCGCVTPGTFNQIACVHP